MAVRIFYWDALENQPKTKASFWKFGQSQQGFQHGNAGDHFNLDLLQWAYPGQHAANVKDEGRRLLLVGSVAHRVLDGDIVCGIGSKHSTIPAADGLKIRVWGVRGPMTLDAFRQAGHDVSQLRFMGDPGVLIGKLYPDVLHIRAEAGNTIFIPHYRERFEHRSNRHYKVVSIDATPRAVAEEICRAEFVYTSSLHGLIWAHALGRPALLVSPQTDESLHKYRDYFLSIGKDFCLAASIDEALKSSKPNSSPDLSAMIGSVALPSAAELASAGILS